MALLQDDRAPTAHALHRTPAARALCLADLPLQNAQALPWRNALYAAPPWHAGGAQWQWQQAQPRPVRCTVLLQAGSEWLRLGLSDDVVGLDAALDAWADHPEPARRVMWALAHEPFLDALAQVFGRDWVPQAVTLAPGEPTPPPDATGVQAGFVCRHGALHIAGIATCSAGALRAAFDRHHAAAPVDAAASVWARGRARLRCVIDRVPATAADLRQLCIGAVILLDNPTLADAAARVHLLLGRQALLCELCGPRLLVLAVDAPPSGDATMVDPIVSPAVEPGAAVDAAAEPTAPPLRADALPIALRFEAGSVSLPLAQLASVRPGFVFELPHGLGQGTISVFANGVAVGRGELVRIGDVVGVRLTQLDATAQ
jgi:type III secretion system YscQ/HrcQ family protein